MSSYFEIGGRIVETLEDVNDLMLLTENRSKKEHNYQKEILRETQGAVSSLQLARSPKERPAESDVSFFEHYKRTSFHNLNEFGKLTRREQLYYVRNPHLFAIWAIGHQLEVIGMHYDYVTGQ